MKITFLGTGAMQPTRERGLQALHVQCASGQFLFDCGEGTQRQFKGAGLKMTRLDKVFLSHFHGDHVLGFPGLLRSLGANNYQGHLEVYGPDGIEMIMHHMKHAALYRENVSLKLHSLEEGIVYEDDKIKIEAKKLKHSCPCFGFRLTEKGQRKMNLGYLKKFGLEEDPVLGKLQRGEDIVWKGKKISVQRASFLGPSKIAAFVFDTSPCAAALFLAKNADVLITESTFSSEEKEKALEYQHLTAKQAAEIAKKAKAKRLVLTHFSQRYKDVSDLKREAEKIFPNVICAKDFFCLEI